MLQLYSWSIWNSADIHQSFAAAALELTTRFYFHSLPSAQDTWEGNQREREGSRRKNVSDEQNPYLLPTSTVLIVGRATILTQRMLRLRE